VILRIHSIEKRERLSARSAVGHGLITRQTRHQHRRCPARILKKYSAAIAVEAIRMPRFGKIASMT
jgi:hypothetical protein